LDFFVLPTLQSYFLKNQHQKSGGFVHINGFRRFLRDKKMNIDEFKIIIRKIIIEKSPDWNREYGTYRDYFFYGRYEDYNFLSDDVGTGVHEVAIWVDYDDLVVHAIVRGETIKSFQYSWNEPYYSKRKAEAMANRILKYMKIIEENYL
jgi:hypothetical protein